MKKFLKNIYIDDEFIMISHVLVSILVLTIYLMIVPLNIEEFNFLTFKNTYMYYMIFQFILFSISILHFTVDKCFTLESIFKNFIKTSLLTFFNIPLILIIFISGNVESLNFIYPLLMQNIFGWAIVSLKQWMVITNKLGKYAAYITHFIVFFVNILSLSFLYMYYKHSKIVITTVYDKDIPLLFFLNPILSMGGYINMEITDYTQLGIAPIVWNLLFWGTCIILNIFLLKFIYKKIGGSKGAVENCS